MAGVSVGRTGCGRAGLVDGELLVVDCGDCALPSRQGLFEADVDGVYQVVAFPGKENVWFLVHC